MNKWFAEQGMDGDVAVSSRVRLARNYKKWPFPGRLSKEDADKIADIAIRATDGLGLHYTAIRDLDEYSAPAMVARHLISPPFSKSQIGGILKSDDEALCVMINEEDHLRIQSLASGNNLKGAYLKADNLDNALSEGEEYAFSDNLGYLTKCPTNLGTGLRASVMLHLPALEENGDIRKLMGMLTKLGLTVRGTFGESTKAVGNLYQISNQVTLGIDEKASISNLSAIVSQITERERAAREALYKGDIQFEDRFYRSIGILKNARLMSGEELYGHLSVLRVGLGLGLMSPEKASVINELLFCTSAGEIAGNEKREMSAEERDARRSIIVRESELFK